MTNQTIRRDEIDEKPGISSTRKAPRVDQYVRLWLDRNLANFPIARDVRVKAKWSRCERDKVWFCKLPSEDRIELVVPLETPEADLRAPTGFDVNCLLLVLARFQQAKKTTIRLDSASAMLRCLGLREHHDNRKQLREALALWTRLTIFFDGIWYTDHQHRKQDRDLPPPLMPCDDGRKVRLHKAWRPIVMRDLKYQCRVPVPLPMQAAPQCAVSMILTSKIGQRLDFESNCERLVAYHQRSQAGFARKCGLDRDHPRRRLKRALGAAGVWFKQVGGDLDCIFGPFGDKVGTGQLAFIAAMPEPVWEKVSAEKRARTPGSKQTYTTPETDVHDPQEGSKTDVHDPHIKKVTNVTKNYDARNVSPYGDTRSLRSQEKELLDEMLDLEGDDPDDTWSNPEGWDDPSVHFDEHAED